MNGIFIAVINLLVLRLGPSASQAGMAAFLIGSPPGSIAAIWLSGKVSTQTSEP